jgi:glycosyltransferase involved in cell wall biosynthesis
MIRIVMISPLPPQRTGEASYTARLVQSIAKSGKVRVVAIAGQEADPLESSEGMIETLGIWDGRSVKYPFVLLKQIRERRPHLVHVQFGPYGKVYGGMFGEVMLLLLILLRLTGIKTTVTLHSTWMPWQVKARMKRYRRLGKIAILAAPFFRLYMRLLNWGTSTLQLSTVKEDSALKREFLAAYGFRHEKVLEIPHPCTQPNQKEASQFVFDKLGLKGRRIILVFGFIRPGKGIDTALKAMALLKNNFTETLLLVAGKPQAVEGERHLNELRDLVARLDLKNTVRFDTRFIPQEEVPGYFAGSTLLLVPYSESVGASGPIHGYAGYGIPIIASDAGFHNRESLGGNLTLFRAGDSEHLAKRLATALSSPELRKNLSQLQREYVQRETWDLAVERTLRNYQKTLN